MQGGVRHRLQKVPEASSRVRAVANKVPPMYTEGIRMLLLWNRGQGGRSYEKPFRMKMPFSISFHCSGAADDLYRLCGL